MNEDEKERKPKIIFSYQKSPDYKQFYVTGARGGSRPYDFRLDFYDEEPKRPESEIIDEKERKTISDEVSVKREYKVGLTFSYRTLLELTRFLNREVEKMKDQGMLFEEQ